MDRKVSVIVTTYGGIRYLQKTLPSIFKQKGIGYEVIVVDTKRDCLLKNYLLTNYPSVIYVASDIIRAKNHGMNLGSSMASGEYLFFLDDDVLLHGEDVFKEMWSNALLLDRFGCYSISIYNSKQENSCTYGKYFGKVFTKNSPMRSYNQVLRLHNSLIGHPTGAGIFINKELFSSIGGFDEDYIFGGDDSDLGIKLWVHGYKCYLFSKNIHEHVGMANREDNLKYAQYFEDKFNAHLGVITKNYRVTNLVYMLPLYILYMFGKALKQSITRRNIGSIKGFCRGLFTFVKNMPSILRKRQKMQSFRKVKSDIFFKIKEPECK